jgi:Spy/CpxP family protein refolding chaperone
MKPLSIFAISALSIGLAFSASARADDPASPPTPPPPTPPAAQTSPADGTDATPHRRHMRGYVLSDLTEKLALTADQQKQVGAIIDNGTSQSKQVRADDTLSKDDKRQKMMDIMKSTHDQIRAVLTPDQQTQFDALNAHGHKPKSPDTN